MFKMATSYSIGSDVWNMVSHRVTVEKKPVEQLVPASAVVKCLRIRTFLI